MAKKASSRDIVVTPADLARALEGIAQSIAAVRRLVTKLPPDIKIKVTVESADTSAFLWDYNCPPPE